MDPDNASHFTRLQQAIDKIEAHPEMEGIQTAPPIPRGGIDPRTGKSGYNDVFLPTTVATDLNAAGESEMAGNFFWQNSFLTPLAGIPFNSRAMEIMQERNFKDPTPSLTNCSSPSVGLRLTSRAQRGVGSTSHQMR